MKSVLFVPIQKVDVEKREVWGRAVQETVDKANEIFDYASSKPLFESWSAEFAKASDGKSLGNIRAMHNRIAAGKMIAMTCDDVEKAIDIGTKIVDDNEWNKVIEGVYTGFSIGGSYEKRWKDSADATKTRYTAAPAEISLVDNPCVPTATFSVVKADGSSEAKPFQHYGALKAVIADPSLTNGDLFKLATAYLPDAQLEEMAKAETTMGEVRAALKKLSDETPAPEAEPLKTESAPEPTPEPETEKVAKTLRKGMYSIAELASCLSTVAYIATDAQWEAEYEKDSSTIPEELRTWLAAGVAIFKKMSAEESDELLASITPATKMALAPLAKVDLVAEIRALLKSDEPAADDRALLKQFMAGDALEKVASLEKLNADLTEQLEKVTAQRDEIAKNAASLLETRKGSLRVVDKSGDQADLNKTDDPTAKPTDAIAEMKKSFQKPTLMSARPVAKT